MIPLADAWDRLAMNATDLDNLPRGPRLEVDYLNGGIGTYRPGETFGPRVAIDFELVWIIAGDAIYRGDGKEYFSPPGAILLSKPGARESYIWDPQESTRHAFLHFNIRKLVDDWPSPTQWPVLRIMPARDVVRPILRQILVQWCFGPGRSTGNDPPRSLIRLFETALDQLLSDAANLPSLADRELPVSVQKALDFANSKLQRDGRTDITLDDLASVAAVSPKHLCRLFNATFAVSPMRIVRLMRLERAVVLLSRSNLNMAQVADRCGFASQFHFSRCFRETYGQPPSAVRKLISKGQPPPPPPVHLGVWSGVEW
jgi:AraC-like DNA-binding protein